jgi:hypothetical protein
MQLAKGAHHAALPLLAFKHHVGPLFIDTESLEFVCELGVGEFALVEKGRLCAGSSGRAAEEGAAAARGCADHHPSVVVKSYVPHLIATPEDFRELLLEATRLKRLRHP